VLVRNSSDARRPCLAIAGRLHQPQRKGRSCWGATTPHPALARGGLGGVGTGPQLGDLWREAGLINVKEESLTIEQAYASFNDYWEPFTKGAGPGGAYVVSLSQDRREQLEARIRKRLLGDRNDGQFKLTATAWCVRGEVPK
jgi:hypothetical protein